MRHEAVQEVCVVGVPDSFWGEAVKAVIVLREGHSAAPAEIVGWCREHLASYKRPRFVEFVTSEQVPRSTTGKILRHEFARWPVSEAQRV